MATNQSLNTLLEGGDVSFRVLKFIAGFTIAINY